MKGDLEICRESHDLNSTENARLASGCKEGVRGTLCDEAFPSEPLHASFFTPLSAARQLRRPLLIGAQFLFRFPSYALSLVRPSIEPALFGSPKTPVVCSTRKVAGFQQDLLTLLRKTFYSLYYTSMTICPRGWTCRRLAQVLALTSLCGLVQSNFFGSSLFRA